MAVGANSRVACFIEKHEQDREAHDSGPVGHEAERYDAGLDTERSASAEAEPERLTATEETSGVGWGLNRVLARRTAPLQLRGGGTVGAEVQLRPSISCTARHSALATFARLAEVGAGLPVPVQRKCKRSAGRRGRGSPRQRSDQNMECARRTRSAPSELWCHWPLARFPRPATS